jgi:hypothetical protein
MAKSPTEIIKEWSEDSERTDETNVHHELLRTSKIHAKYVKYMAEGSLLGKKRAIEYQTLRAVKHDYYTGTMSKEDLDDRGWKPYLYTVKSREGIDRCMEKDEDLNKLLIEKALFDETAAVCKEILKELSNRTWALRAWVDYQKYLLGN